MLETSVLLDHIKDFAGIWCERTLFWLTRSRPRMWGYNWVDSGPIWTIPSQLKEARSLIASNVSPNANPHRYFSGVDLSYKARGYDYPLSFCNENGYVFPGGEPRVQTIVEKRGGTLIGHSLPCSFLRVICDPKNGAPEHYCFLLDLARKELFQELNPWPEYVSWIASVVPQLRANGKYFKAHFQPFQPTVSVLDLLQHVSISKDVALLIMQYSGGLEYKQGPLLFDRSSFQELEPIAALPYQEDSAKNENILSYLVRHHHTNLQLASYYNDSEIPAWESVAWKQDADFLLLIGSSTSTLLHCIDEDEELDEDSKPCKVLWAGMIGNGTLLIKNSRTPYYGGERYSFHYIGKNGKRKQKSINFNGGFPTVSYIERFNLIVMYTREEIYIRYLDLERFATIDLSTVENRSDASWSYNFNLDIACMRKNFFFFDSINSTLGIYSVGTTV